MSTHYISGSSEKKNSSSISMAATSTRTDVKEAVQTNPEKTDGNAKASGAIGTIIRSASSPVLGITSANGNVAVQLGTAPVVGTSFQIDGAYPLSGGYGIIGSSGSNWALTDRPYVACTGISSSGTYTLDSGTLAPVAQREFLIMKVTNNLAGQANSALKLNKSNGSSSLHQFRSYRSRVYTTNWQAFTGSVSPCDITTTTVTLNVDDSITEHTVIMNVAGQVKAADITIPDTVGLRNPAL